MVNFEDLNVAGDGTVLKFRKFQGNPKKTPVVIVHGLTGNLVFMQGLAMKLVGTGRTIYTYDLRGRGKSEKPKGNYSSEIHARDLEAAIQSLGHSRCILVAHSLGTWIALSLAKKNSNILEKLVLLDGGGHQSLLQKLKNLQMVQKSLTRLGKIFPSADDYISEIAGSPFFATWKKEWASLFDYELEKREGESVICNIPMHVMESELRSLGASATWLGLFLFVLTSPIRWINAIKAGKNLEYSKVLCPTLVVRALGANLKPGDCMLPDKAYQSMLKKIPKARGLSLHEFNHYGMILEDCQILAKEILQFCD